MNGYQEVNGKIEVPRNAGIDGFLLAIKQILRLPRVSRLVVDDRGAVTFTRYAREDESTAPVAIDFETVGPAASIRSSEVTEITPPAPGESAAVAVARLFAQSGADRMYPVAFATGADSSFGAWHQRTTGVAVGPDTAYGLPLLPDRHLPDDSLVLCTAYGPGGSLIDVRRSYRVLVPRVAP